MIEKFNRINKRFGSSRVTVISWKDSEIQILIIGWAEFSITDTGVMQIERQGDNMQLRPTSQARWLAGVADGMVRDDAGNLVPA